jgi:hypothetical protein
VSPKLAGEHTAEHVAKRDYHKRLTVLTLRYAAPLRQGP